MLTARVGRPDSRKSRGGHPGGGGCGETLPPQAGSTCTVPQGRGAEGRARRPEAPALGEDEVRPGCRNQAASDTSGPQLPRSRVGSGGLGAAAEGGARGRASPAATAPARASQGAAASPTSSAASLPPGAVRRPVGPPASGAGAAPGPRVPPRVPRPCGPYSPQRHGGPGRGGGGAGRAGRSSGRAALGTAGGDWDGEERAGAEGEPHARGDFSPPRGRRRGREGRRRPRCLNPFQAAAPRESPPSQRRNPRLRSARSHPGSPSPSVGGRAATSPTGARFRPRSFSKSPAHLDAWESGHHPPPAFSGWGRTSLRPHSHSRVGATEALRRKALLCDLDHGRPTSAEPQSPPPTYGRPVCQPNPLSVRPLIFHSKLFCPQAFINSFACVPDPALPRVWAALGLDLEAHSAPSGGLGWGLPIQATSRIL